MNAKIKNILNLWIKTELICLTILALGLIMLTGGASDISTLKNVDFILQSDKNIVEGQNFNVYVKTKNKDSLINRPVVGFIKFIDLDYTYQNRIINYKPFLISYDSPEAIIRLTSKTSGHKSIFCTTGGSDVNVLKIYVKPLKATMFPVNWEKYKHPDQNPEQWSIWVNLFYSPDKQRQYLQIVYNNQIVQRMLVSAAASGLITPEGDFTLGRKEYYPRSIKYGNTPMPFWNELHQNNLGGEIGIHGLEGDYYMYLLGQPASHGCIRASRLPTVEVDETTKQETWGDRGAAKWIYDRVPIDTKIHVFNKEMPDFIFQDYVGYLKEKI